MENIETADILLWLGAAFIAVVVIVRLMRSYRDQLMVQLHDQMAREQERRRAEAKRQKQAAQNAERKAS